MEPHNILHILPRATPESTSFARIVSGLARGLDPERYRVHAWFLSEDGPLSSFLSASGAEVRIIGWHGVRNDLIGSKRFWHALRAMEPEIVHLHSRGTGLRYLVRSATRAPIVLHLHSMRDESKLLAGPVKRKVGSADIVIATSQSVANTTIGLRPIVVYPGVHVPDSARVDQARALTTTRILGTACRLVPIKGIVHLLNAIGRLRLQIPDVRLEIAGSGPEEAALQRQVARLGLTDVVRFLGWQKDLESAFARWEVFVMSSLDEGFGIAALEAMAFGLPVVATNVGGVSELVEDGRTGRLVVPADSQALAECLSELLLNSELRSRMGSAARNRVRNFFSMDRMVSEIAKIYDQILGRSH